MAGAIAAAAGSAMGSSVAQQATQAALNVASGFIEQELVEKNMRKSMHYAQRMARNRYQWARRDLEAAGLNPMLAFGGVPGGHAPSAGGSPDFDLGQARLQGAEMAHLQAQTELVQAQAAKTRAETPKAELFGTGWKFLLDRVKEVQGAGARLAPPDPAGSLLDLVKEKTGASARSTGSFWEQPEIKALREHLSRLWSNKGAEKFLTELFWKKPGYGIRTPGVERQPPFSKKEKEKLRIGNL